MESPPSSAVTELAGMSDEGLDEQIKGINQLLNAPGTMEPVTENNLKAMVKAYAKERDNRRAAKARPKFKALSDDEILALSDDAIDIEIYKTNNMAQQLDNPSLGSGPVDMEELARQQKITEFADELRKLVKERNRRSGGEGTAGASKVQQPLEHMTNYGGKPLAEPGAGWIGSDAFNIQNFTEAADFGDLDTLIDNARPGKSGMWAFTEDPDPAIFSINGFLNRLSNPGHEANNVELVHLVKILTKAKKRKSIGDKNSMAEDLWTNIAGPTKELLRGFGFEL